MKIHTRVFIALGYGLYFVVTYFLIRHYVVSRGVFYSPVLPLEDNIPFLPGTFFIYILVYFVPLTAFLLMKERRHMFAAMWAFGVGVVFHEIIWLIYPVEFILRPDLPIDTPNFFMKMVALFFKLDSPPINCFPSLHVTYAFLTFYAMHIFRPRFAKIFLILAIVISFSTLTFKQHFVADVLAGFAIAVILKSIFFRHHETR